MSDNKIGNDVINSKMNDGSGRESVRGRMAAEKEKKSGSTAANSGKSGNNNDTNPGTELRIDRTGNHGRGPR
jgi:hypothetical protein